jgi:hypothetical protein
LRIPGLGHWLAGRIADQQGGARYRPRLKEAIPAIARLGSGNGTLRRSDTIQKLFIPMIPQRQLISELRPTIFALRRLELEKTSIGAIGPLGLINDIKTSRKKLVQKNVDRVRRPDTHIGLA